MATESLKAKVKRALELQAEMARLNTELKAAKEEYNEIMENEHIYDKVMGLRMGGII